MTVQTSIVIASRSQEAIDRYAAHLAGREGFQVKTNLIVNGMEPLDGVERLPDILLLHMGANRGGELELFGKRAPDRRPPAIVIAERPDADLMRQAMRAGSRDFYAEPIEPSELIDAIERLAPEAFAKPAGRSAMTAFINAKGGQGASFLATNLAHALQTEGDHETVLVDLDLQYAPLGHYLDLQGRLGLFDAITHAKDLDDVALRAYLTRHASGLNLLGGVRGDDAVHLDLSSATIVDNWVSILQHLATSFDQVVVDLPRQFDALSIATLERADCIMLVLQQSLPSIRDAVYIRQVLRRDLRVEPERIRCVVNRFDKRSAVELRDVQRALSVEELVLIPNDHQSSAESIELGKPVADVAPRSPITRSLKNLALELGGTSVERKGRAKSLFSFLGN